MTPDEADVARVFRAEYGRVVAALIRVVGDIDVAEDAVQEAFATALARWPSDGLPANPAGWITTTARNRAISHWRREERGRQLVAEMGRATSRATRDEWRGEEVESVGDDRLRLVFTCCHPSLSAEAQVALTLRLLGGLTTREVADAFLVPERTMAQRLVRAKRKIRAAGVPYRVPDEAELPARVQSVLTVIYLIYNAGADASPVERPAGDDVRGEAIRLARMMHRLMPDDPEAAGLLGLLLLTEARRPARFTPDGDLVLLREQDRRSWDASMIDEGHGIVRVCLRRGQPGAFQVQAAISAVHTDAETFDHTDWGQIVALYTQLADIAPTPVVALNRAIAVAELDGPAAGLALLDDVDLPRFHAYHAARADMLSRRGRRREAAEAYQAAAELAPTQAARDHLTRRGQAQRDGTTTSRSAPSSRGAREVTSPGGRAGQRPGSPTG